jgi:hypothetical protein
MDEPQRSDRMHALLDEIAESVGEYNGALECAKAIGVALEDSEGVDSTAYAAWQAAALPLLMSYQARSRALEDQYAAHERDCAR